MNAKDMKQMTQRAGMMTQMRQAPDLTIGLSTVVMSAKLVSFTEDSSQMTSEEITKACERAHKIKEGKLEPLCLWVRAGERERDRVKPS